MIAYGAPAALLQILATINSRLDVVLIGHTHIAMLLQKVG